MIDLVFSFVVVMATVALLRLISVRPTVGESHEGGSR
jgi:hypothetical protein